MRALIAIVVSGLCLTSCRALLGFDEEVIVAGDGIRRDARIGDGAIDGAEATCIAIVCEAAGGTCDLGGQACVISGVVRPVCPPGMPCRVDCTGTNACASGVDCADATLCEVACIGIGACQAEGVSCGKASACAVTCIGDRACEGFDVAIRCETSTCEVTCAGTLACLGIIDAVPGGTCTAHCCDGACGSVDPLCTRDAVCS